MIMQSRNLILVLCLMVISLSEVFASPTDIPKDKQYCDVAILPDGSGENNTDKFYAVKVFPRRSNMGENYNGCQTVWIEINGTFLRSMVIYYDGGKLQIMKHIDPKNQQTTEICLYKDNKLLSKKLGCEDVEPSIQKGLGPPVPSMPGGCIEKIRESVAKGKESPSECTYD